MSDAFGRRLRAYRKLKRWTQMELAHHMGVSVAIIGGLERGTRSPNRKTLARLEDVLNVTRSELFGGETEEQIESQLDEDIDDESGVQGL